MSDTTPYYATYNPRITEPAPVAAYYDSRDTPWLDFSAEGFINLTEAQWTNRNTGYWAVQSGQLVAYNPTPVVVVVPLQSQAVTAQTWIQQQANLAAAMGEVFTADMKTYVKTIAAIASGTDTTSTALPAQPTDVMAASTATGASS